MGPPNAAARQVSRHLLKGRLFGLVLRDRWNIKLKVFPVMSKTSSAVVVLNLIIKITNYLLSLGFELFTVLKFKLPVFITTL